MERKNQPFCNTSEVLAEISRLGNFKSNDWRGFTGDCDTFADLQKKVKVEYDYLQSFWAKNDAGDIDHVKDEMFIPWNCLPAFDDFSQESQDFASGRGKYKRFYNSFCKYDIFHEREHYLENLLWAIHRLFHDWHFVTQGWTAY